MDREMDMHKDVIRHFIHGKELDNDTQPRLPIFESSTGTHIADCCIADPEIVEFAISAAEAAFPAWSSTPILKRAKILKQFGILLETHQDELAELVSREHGKLLSDAKGSIARAMELVDYAVGAPKLMQGEYSHSVSTSLDCYTFRQPLGICVGVSPFNFPVMVPVWMMVWAIVLGNTFILKPSEQDPSVTNRLAELLIEAGLPDGVMNVLHGDASTVNTLITHPKVAAVSAVASTPVAKQIYQTAIAHGKRAQTFGGAKNHAVVLPDAMNAQTANAIIAAAYGSAGERCMAISVMVVIESEETDKFISMLKHKIAKLKLGHSQSADADMGPLISYQHKESVLNAIAQGIKEGAQLICDGSNLQVSGYEKGYFVGPCLFDRVTSDMSLYKNEIFGPVLSIVRMKNLQESIALINANPYGNGTAIFTQNGAVAREFTHAVTIGMVGVNVATPVPVAHHPFGGWKQSSFGDTGMHGEESLHFYTRSKSVTSRWAEDDAGPCASLAMPTHA